MKEGMTLDNLTTEVKRQAQVREDYLVLSSHLKLVSGMQGWMNGMKDMTGADSKESAPSLSTPVLATPAGTFPMTELALEQMAGQLGMPLRYVRKLQTQNPHLLDLNINTLLMEDPQERLVRTLDGQARAFLSPRYRRLDNDQLLQSVWPVVEELGLTVGSADLTPQRLYLKLVSPKLTADVRVGDPVQAGLVISNSEVGCGAVSIALLIYRLVCTNGMTVGEGDFCSRRYHFGQRLRGVARGGDGDSYQLVLDETQEAVDKLFWQELRDEVRFALHEEHFNAVLAQLQQAAQQNFETEPAIVAERLAGRYGLKESEREAVLLRLEESGDSTLYGLVNAITRMSQDVGSYERATELERLGGTLLHIGPREWRGLSLN